MNPLLKYYIDRWNRKDALDVPAHYIEQVLANVLLCKDEGHLEEFEAFMYGRVMQSAVLYKPFDLFKCAMTMKLIDGKHLIVSFKPDTEALWLVTMANILHWMRNRVNDRVMLVDDLRRAYVGEYQKLVFTKFMGAHFESVLDRFAHKGASTSTLYSTAMQRRPHQIYQRDLVQVLAFQEPISESDLAVQIKDNEILY